MDAKTRRRVLMQGDAVPEGWAVSYLSEGSPFHVFTNAKGLKYFYANNQKWRSAYINDLTPANVQIQGFLTDSWSHVYISDNYKDVVSMQNPHNVRLLGENFGNMTDEEIIAYGKSLKMIYKL